MIEQVLTHYFPNWEAPVDNGYTPWIACECPVHNDDHPSASVSFQKNAFCCHGCGYKGDYLKIIMEEEGVSYAEAVRIAERIAEAGGVEVPLSAPRKRSRGVPRFKRFNRL